MDDEFDSVAISKGKLSIAEALKEIGTVKTAFQKAERIEKKLSYHDSILAELQKIASTLATYDYVNTRFDEINSRIEHAITQNFEKFTSQYLVQLNEKVSMKEMETVLAHRVTWAAFNNFTQQTNVLKSRIEKHIISDFESFKTKVKIELSKKANEKKPEDDINVDEIHQLKNRVTSLEQKYHDMFMEEGLDDSDDYDSQEEMDNMMDDIDRAALRERNDSDEGLNEGDQEPDEIPAESKSDIPGTPTTQNSEPLKSIQTPFTSPPNVSPGSISPPVIEISKVDNYEPKPADVFVDPVPEKQEVPVQKKIIDLPVEENKGKDENIGKSDVGKKEKKLIEVSKPETVEISNPPQALIAEETKIEAPSVATELLEVPTNAGNRESSPKHASKPPGRSTIEVDAHDQSHAKYARTKGSSKNDGQTLSRKNSVVSSRSGTNQGGGPGNMRSVNKKIAGLQKEIEGYKGALEESKQTLLEYQAEIARAYEKISEVRSECKEIENKRQTMEISFIKALRRNGIDKKNKAKAVTVANINIAQLNKIKKMIDEKSKKMVSIETYVEKMAADTLHIKDVQINRINELVQYVKFLDESRVQLSKEFSSTVGMMKQLEGDMKSNLNNVHNEVVSIQGPIIDLISEQQRENHILNQDIKKQQSVINGVIEEYTKSGSITRESAKRSFGSVPNTASPDVSLKYKFTSTKNGNRRISVKTSDNWLELIPDGNPLVLPRIAAATPIHSKKKSLQL